jgi:signal transduction histidine kinase
MISAQSGAQQSDKSKGRGHGRADSLSLNGASEEHAVGRVGSGFNLMEVIAEYRALRASVIRLWRESNPDPDARDLEDLTRFNESIDQSLTKAAGSYTNRVDQSREMFLAILGHDLRSPLFAITMSAEALSRGRDVDAESAEFLSQISASTDTMARMIRDLLDYTRTRLGSGMPVSPASMDLGALCRDVFDEVRVSHPACTLRFEPQGDLTGQWDAARLRQVVSNLFVNAVQHGGEPCEADLSARSDGPDVVLAVHNGGAPIPPDVLPTLFDPTVRRSLNEPHRRPGSIGLGLYIVREVVAAHGGAIDVKSSPEAGTVFTVRLPRQRTKT